MQPITFKDETGNVSSSAQPDITSSKINTIEALSSGLRLPQTCNSRLARLAYHLGLADTSKEQTSSIPDFIFLPGKRVSISDKEHRQFLADFRHGVAELELRVQRLQVRALSVALRGIHYSQELDNAQFDWDAKLPISKLLGCAAHYAHGNRRFDARARGAVIRRLNHFLPQEYALAPNQFAGSHDAALYHDLAWAMVYCERLRDRDAIIRAEEILKGTRRIQKELKDMRTAPLLSGISPGDAPYEGSLQDLWRSYRALLKDFAALAEAYSWFSPTYGASLTPQRGPSQSSQPFRTDYQRFSMPEGEDLERKLHRVIFRQTGTFEPAESAVFGGGLNALDAIFRLNDRQLSHERLWHKAAARALIFQTSEIYFEVDLSVQEYCQAHAAELKTFAPGDTAELVRSIKEEHPQMVFLCPVANSYSMSVTDIHGILEALCDREWVSGLQRKGPVPSISLVIDNTLASTLATWPGFDFIRLPRFIKVFSFESLIKFAQDGLELAPAGLVTAIGDDAAPQIDSIRKRRGFMPPENTIRKLDFFTDRDALERKMARHSRNTRLLARELSKACKNGAFLAEVICPYLPTHPQFKLAKRQLRDAGGILNVGLSFNFLNGSTRSQYSAEFVASSQVFDQHSKARNAELVANSFLKLVVKLARFMDVEFNLGTSFGFNVTRAAVYDQSFGNDPNRPKIPYIRIATGTETSRDIKLIAACFRRADEMFGEAIKRGNVLALAQALESGKVELRTSDSPFWV